MEKKRNSSDGNRIFAEKNIRVKKLAFISDRMSYMALRGREYNIIVLNVHTKVKSDDSKDTFYGELEQVFLSFSQ
jgi:hypothetical protein